MESSEVQVDRRDIFNKAWWKYLHPSGNRNDHVRMLKEGHTITIYQGTNCGFYTGVQCNTDSCPGFGHKMVGCPYSESLGSYNDDRLEEVLEWFVELGFEPIDD